MRKETPQFMYRLTVTGKAPRKRKASEWAAMVEYHSLDVPVPEFEMKTIIALAKNKVRELKLRDARFDFVRTVVTPCEYDDGTVMILEPLFNLHLVVLAYGPVIMERE